MPYRGLKNQISMVDCRIGVPDTWELSQDNVDPPNTIIRFIGTHQNGTLNFGKPFALNSRFPFSLPPPPHGLG